MTTITATAAYRPCPCSICGRRPVRVGCVTCCNSFCQEASYARNALFAGRRLSPSVREALRDQDDRATDSAVAWGRSR